MAVSSNKISTLWYALLGLVKMHPNTGYGLRKIFQETPMAHYSSSPGAIYPALQNLESRKLIVGHAATGKTGREKLTYRCTSLGTRTLFRWLREPVTVSQIQRGLDVVLLKFSYLDLLQDIDWSLEFLEQFIASTEQTCAQLRLTKSAMQSNQPPHGQLALANGIAILQTHIQWAKSAVAELSNQK